MTGRRLRVLWTMLMGFGVALAAATVASGASLHPKLLAKVGYGATPVGFARTADGTLHVAFETNTSWGDSANGIGALSITSSGHVGPQVQALSWNGVSGGSPNGIPGLAVMGGALQATFGGSPSGDDGPWGISSADGGNTWSAPADIGSGSMEFGDSHVDIQVSNGTPVLTGGCCGGISIQQGIGAGSPTYQLVNSTDGNAGNTDSAVDAATGAVIDSWDSLNGTGGQWLQQVAPGQPGGPAVKLAVPTQYGSGIPAIIAGRDTGPGVFAAYPTNYANTTHMSLFRYGGGSVSVGSVKHLHTNTWGAATGPDGRIWVMWSGQNTKTGKGEAAITRSNKAVTKFEPIQTYGANWSFLFYLSGDGRLGPLDMLVSGTPASPPSAAGGIYYMRFLAVLSAHVSAKSLGGGKFKLTVKVTDAGDAVSGADVSAAGKSGTTSSTGKATLTISGSPGSHVTVKISDSGYQTLRRTITL